MSAKGEKKEAKKDAKDAAKALAKTAVGQQPSKKELKAVSRIGVGDDGILPNPDLNPDIPGWARPFIPPAWLRPHTPIYRDPYRGGRGPSAPTAPNAPPAPSPAKPPKNGQNATTVAISKPSRNSEIISAARMRSPPKTAPSAKMNGILLALSQLFPEYIQGVPAMANTGPGETQVVGKTSRMKGSVTLVQGTASADTNYYGAIVCTNSISTHVVYTTTFNGSNPAGANSAGFVNVPDPLYTALGADVNLVQLQSSCINIFNTTNVVARGGSVVACNTIYSNFGNGTTFGTILALDTAVQASFSEDATYCMRWDPRRVEDFTPLTAAGTANTASTCIIFFFRSTAAQTIDFEVTSNWAMQPLDTLIDVMGAVRSPVDNAAMADTISRLSPERLLPLQVEAGPEEERTVLGTILDMGKGVWNAAKEYLGAPILDGIASLASGLLGSQNTERILRRVAIASESEFRSEEHLPPQVRDALCTLASYRYYFSPAGDHAIYERRSDCARWEFKREETKDPLNGSTVEWIWREPDSGDDALVLLEDPRSRVVHPPPTQVPVSRPR